MELYYNLNRGLPDSLESPIANTKLSDQYDMASVYMLMYDSEMDSLDKGNMIEQIKETDGVKWALSLSSILGSSFPESFVPDNLREIFQSNDLELAFVCSDYSTATDPANAQKNAVNVILKSYDPGTMIIGEAPLMKDLQDVTDVALNLRFLSIWQSPIIREPLCPLWPASSSEPFSWAPPLTMRF